MTDEIHTLSEALALDPSSLAFVRLGELLRQRGELELAERVAQRGLERHPRRVDAHELAARVALDRGDDTRASGAWEAVLTLSPGHAAALKGLGFLEYRRGNLEAARRYLESAMSADPGDASMAAALDAVRGTVTPKATGGPRTQASRVITPPAGAMQTPLAPFAPTAVDARLVFDAVLDGPQERALLLDADGYVIAGQHLASNGDDVAAVIGAQLAGVSQEADRAIRHLGLGAWTQLVFEAEHASVAMAPIGAGILLVSSPRTTPLGSVRRLLTRALERGRQWLERGT